MELNENTIKINKPGLYRLPNDRYVQLVTEIKDTVVEFGAENLKILKYFESVFLALFNTLLSVFKKDIKSSLTQKIVCADSDRDEALQGFYRFIKANLLHKKPEIRDAAQRIKDKIDSYGNITQKSLDGQTASTTDLLYDLKNKLADNVTLIKAEEWVEEVDLTNKKFAALMKERDAESRDKSDLNVREVRKQLDEAVRTLCKMSEMLAITEGGEIYPKFIKALNVIFARYGAKRSAHTPSGNDGEEKGSAGEDKYPNAREWSEDIDYQTCASGDIFYIVRNGVKEYYKLLDFGEVATFEPGMDDGGIWEKIS